MVCIDCFFFCFPHVCSLLSIAPFSLNRRIEKHTARTNDAWLHVRISTRLQSHINNWWGSTNCPHQQAKGPGISHMVHVNPRGLPGYDLWVWIAWLVGAKQPPIWVHPTISAKNFFWYMLTLPFLHSWKLERQQNLAQIAPSSTLSQQQRWRLTNCSSMQVCNMHFFFFKFIWCGWC